MCGILAVISNSKINNTNLSINFKKALSTTSHRGPSTTVEKFFNNMILGINRLSIVGTANGSQPLSNENKTIHLLCNGEIFNYKLLKGQLKTSHTFQTDSDCEVIIHLYEKYRDNFVKYLKGQFAFILIDEQRKKVFLARDRFGINPLFYSINKDKKILISSEIKSILALDPSISSSLDPIGIKESFYLYGPTPPRTCFNNIFQVKPGNILEFDYSQQVIIKEHRYWKIPDTVKMVSTKEVTLTFLKLLKQSIKRRTQGDDKKLAVYLSGGIDSASIAAILKKISNKHIFSYSIKFKNPDFDESKYQKKIINFLKVKNYSIVAEDTFENHFYQSIWHIEHPLIRTAPIPMYSLSELVRKKRIKFVLCGEGADELLLGYPVFQKNESSIEDKVKKLSEKNKLFSYQKKSGKKMVSDTLKQIKDEFKVNNKTIKYKQLIEIYTKLSRYLLVAQGDRQSISHGVEQRFPFLDEDIIDLFLSLPDGWMISKCLNKKPLRTSMQDLLPTQIVKRKKQGYLAPMSEFLYKSQVVNEIVKHMIINNWNESFDKYFNFSEVKNLIDKYYKQVLSDSDSIALIFTVSTLVLHKQHFN